MNRIRKTIIALALILACPAVSLAVPIIDVSGDPDDFQQVNAGESAGVGFTLEDSLLNAIITPEIFCQSCSGSLLVMQNDVGAGAQLSDIVAAVAFSNGFAPSLSLGDLDPATYFLILVIDTGFGGWIGSDSAAIDEFGNNMYELSLFADENNTDLTFPGATNFSALFGFDLFFNLEGDLLPSVSVPEPSTGILLLSGLLLLVARRRRAFGTAG